MTFRTVLFWAAVVCCVLAQLAILRSVLFGRAATVAPDAGHGKGGQRSIEIAWALLPAVALMFVLYLTWRAVDAQPRPSGPEATASGVTIGA